MSTDTDAASEVMANDCAESAGIQITNKGNRDNIEKAVQKPITVLRSLLQIVALRLQTLSRCSREAEDT